MIYISIALLTAIAGAAIATAYWMAEWRSALGVTHTDYGDAESDYLRRIMELQQELEQAKKNDSPRDPVTGRWTNKP